VAPPQRLKRRAEFLRVAAKGRKAPVHGLVLQALARDDADPARIGFTVTKKVGNAVVRNRTRSRPDRTRHDARPRFWRACRRPAPGVAQNGDRVTLPAEVLAGAVRAYQLTIRPVIGANCRFEPSCSHYAIAALRGHGALRGTALTARRILRCNPWNEGGFDPVPPPDGAFRDTPVTPTSLHGRTAP
jgi:putative membrane protein insertion efficiency factor